MDNDRIYIYKIKQGDITAFSKLIDKYKDMAFNIAYQLTGNTEDAEEITQDAFVKIYKSINDFKGRSKFSTWLYSIVHNTAISKLRKKTINTMPMDDLNGYEINHIDDTQTQISLMNNEDQKKYINLALKDLDSEDRVIVSLFYMEEKKISEISEITGLNDSNIKIKLFRARKKMYSKLHALLNKDIKSIL